MARRILVPVTVNLDLKQVEQVKKQLAGKQSFSGLIRELTENWLRQQESKK